LFVCRQYKKEEQDALLNELNSQVEIVFQKHITANDAGLSTVRMLQQIEERLEHLFSVLERANSQTVIQAEQVSS